MTTVIFNVTSSWTQIFNITVSGIFGIYMNEQQDDFCKGSILFMENGNTILGSETTILNTRGISLITYLVQNLPMTFQFENIENRTYEIRKNNNYLEIRLISGDNISIEFTLFTNIIGPTGPQGNTGVTGATGPTGPLNPSFLVSSVITTSTTSTTYTLINSMTFTPAAGNYLVNFNASGMISSSSATGNYAIYVGGVQAADSIRIIRPNNTSATQVLYTQTKITVNGSQSVEIRYLTSASTFTVYQRNMTLLQVL